MNRIVKTLGAIVLVLVLGTGSYLLYKNLQKIDTTDPVSVLRGLKRDSEVSFSRIQDVDMKWILSTDMGSVDSMIPARGIRIEGVGTDEKYDVRYFLKEYGFELDVLNMTAESVVTLSGYKNEDVACTVIIGVSGYRTAPAQWVPENTLIRDVEVACGRLDDLEITESDEDLIKRIFVEKYSVGSEKIIVEITQTSGKFVRGIVSMGSLDSSNAFFAAQEKEGWVLIHEGKGAIPCNVAESYNVPEELTGECSS